MGGGQEFRWRGETPHGHIVVDVTTNQGGTDGERSTELLA